MDVNNEFFKLHRVAVRLLTGRIMYNIFSFKELFQTTVHDD